MKKKGLVALALAATLGVSSLGLAGCGTKKGDNELWITYFSGGYGDEWVQQLARKFEKENSGVKVRTDPDTQLVNAVPNMMKNGTKYDLIFCHDIAWEDFIAPGYIYCLDDLYASDVGDGVKFADRIWDDDVLASASYPDKNGVRHYYKVPWTIGTAGIAYNLTIMDRVDEWLASDAGKAYLATEQGGGDADRPLWEGCAPKDYYELLQYCYDITAAKLDADPRNPGTEYVKPFTWSGVQEEWQWDYVMFDWWGQLATPNTMNTFKNLGNVDENFKLDISKQKNPNKEVYNPDKFAVARNEDGTLDKENSTYVGWGEFRQAYQLWYNLVVENEHKSWSLEKVKGFSKQQNEHALANGYAAMSPAACWVEYESRKFLTASKQKISLMPTPVISEVKVDKNTGKVLPKGSTGDNVETLDAIHTSATDDQTKTVEINGNRYNRVSFTSSFGDSAMIPAKSSAKKLAVDFLKFMQEEENAKLFTKTSGGTILPYKYNYWESFIDENDVDNASAWQKSIFEICQNSTKFNNYTQHDMIRKTDLKGTEKVTAIWPTNSYYYLKAWQGGSPAGTDAAAGLKSFKPDELIKFLYTEKVSKRWEIYKQDL